MLLEVMNLKQYQALFMAEQIDGKILVECTEEVLQKELEITSKLHRVRLMKIINGHHSAVSIMEGRVPYVQFVKQ